MKPKCNQKMNFTIKIYALLGLYGKGGLSRKLGITLTTLQRKLQGHPGSWRVSEAMIINGLFDAEEKFKE
jgi:hypothetical protein